MKNSQKGFIVPLLIAIIAVLVIGGGVYVYETKKTEAPVVDTTTQQTNNQTPSIQVLSPNGGEVLHIGQTYTILWNTTGLSTNAKVNIILSSVGTGGSQEGDAYQLIATTNNTGKYTWTVTSPMSLSPNNKYTISIGIDSQTIDKTIDTSNPFTITSSSISTSDWKTYANNQYGIQFSYPPLFTLTQVNDSRSPMSEPAGSVKINFGNVVPNVIASTNVSVNQVSENNCYKGKIGPDYTLKVIENGITFYVGNEGDQGMGMATEDHVYATVYNGLCYQLTLNMQWGRNTDGSYTPSFYKKGVEDYFSKIISTFKFTK